MNNAASLSGQRILVVEDEWMIADHLSIMLEDIGCVVLGPIGIVAEALAFVAAEKIDCVLLDANLNGESSAPIADMLVAQTVPFVMVTGYGGLELPTEAMNSAPRLGKPFMETELQECIELALAPPAAS